MIKFWIKFIGCIAILIFTGWVGISYVAPRVLLKLSRDISSSTAADYGLRYDKIEAYTDDSLMLTGDFIYPFHVNSGTQTVNHSIIVLHPILHNTKTVYPLLKSFTTMNVNFITFDSRGHGRSEGHLFTMGIKEAQDISAIIDRIVELYPDHSFGIYARGNTSNIALRAMSNDERIRYGIVENYYENAVEQLQMLNYDDVFVDFPMFNSYVFKHSMNYLKIKEEDQYVQLNKISQPLLLLSTPYTSEKLEYLSHAVNSPETYTQLFNNNILLLPYIKDDEGLRDCIFEFVEIFSEEAKKYVEEKIYYTN